MTLEAETKDREYRARCQAGDRGDTVLIEDFKRDMANLKDAHIAMKKDYEQRIAGLKESVETWGIQAKVHQESLKHCQEHIARLQQDNSQIMQERDQEVEKVGMLRDRLNQYEEDSEKLKSQRAICDIQEDDADDDEEGEEEEEDDDDEFHDVAYHTIDRAIVEDKK